LVLEGSNFIDNEVSCSLGTLVTSTYKICHHKITTTFSETLPYDHNHDCPLGHNGINRK
jgi:hypothetical protein